MDLCNNVHRALNRRDMLKTCCAGFGGLALNSLLAEESFGGSTPASPLSPKSPHFAPRAKRIIFLFMHGGPSHVDTFDPKPVLSRDDGKPCPFPKPRVQFDQTGNLLGTPWKFKQYGQSGAWVSELLPHIASIVDDLCFIKGLHGSNAAHGGALLKLHTGTDVFIRPSMGSWITYGLGTENQSLPGYITICPTLTHGGNNNWSSAFLPPDHAGTPMGRSRLDVKSAKIPYLRNHKLTKKEQRAQLDLLNQFNNHQLEETGHDAMMESRIQSFELAFRMQTEAPDIISLEGETEATKKLYGLDDPVTADFGRQCLLARRFSERGVRFVQCTNPGWDQHGSLREDLTQNANQVDKPVAGLIKDLKSRGLLEDTLVLWGGEFGRTPVCQPLNGERNGRDHNPHGFTMFMAGGGVKPGFSYGETDEYGYYAVKDKVNFHDLHATMLHLLGLDHLKLTYPYAGRDFRLTDVAGDVKHDIIA